MITSPAWDSLFLDDGNVWRPCLVLEFCGEQRLRVQLADCDAVVDGNRVRPYVSALVDSLASHADEEGKRETGGTLQRRRVRERLEVHCT